ncbi:MAG TPA: carbohydrate ABC transporter substrate-binding protein [Anaerolineae bacterium]|nr:carbohydrate ABC transporter substrate-binding protein [Anaerolineae bacterium]
MHKHKALPALLAVLFLVGCSGTVVGETPAPSSEITPSLPPMASPVSTEPASSPENLVLWVVPQFAPNQDTAAGAVLLERLQAFEQSHPDLTITVRIKQEQDPGGLLETLQAASIAAPSTLPDIVSLSPQMLEIAVQADLILPLDDLLNPPASPEWYDFSIDASWIRDAYFGLPFGADGELVAYNINAFSAAPFAWSDLLEGTAYFYFPAGDPQAAFTLNQYLTQGGTLMGTRGSAALEAETLIEVLAYYDALHEAGVLPLIATQYTTADETWNLFVNGQAVAALAPLRTFFDQHDPRFVSAVPLPAQTDGGSIFVETWSWAVVPHDSTRHTLAVELLEWLSDPTFLGPWTDALNLLPPTGAALAAWPDSSKASIASRLVLKAQTRPTDEILDVFGPLLQDAINQILLGTTTPEEAAATVIQALQ